MLGKLTFVVAFVVEYGSLEIFLFSFVKWCLEFREFVEVTSKTGA